MRPAHFEIGQLGGNLLTRGIVARNPKKPRDAAPRMKSSLLTAVQGVNTFKTTFDLLEKSHLQLNAWCRMCHRTPICDECRLACHSTSLPSCKETPMRKCECSFQAF